MSTVKSQPYNPLDKLNLAKSIENELLGRPGMPLSETDSIVGAGVYVMYYSGPFHAYAPISSANQDGVQAKPIYVGKAIPKGGRKGGLSRDVSASGKALADRLRHHESSISEASNLEVALDGFGNKDPGKRRATQYKSPWDIVHPGRKFAEKLADAPASAELLIQRIEDYLAGKPLARLPKVLAEQEAAEQAEAEEAADEI